MSDRDHNSERFFELAAIVCDGDASQDECSELDAIARADQASSRRYLRYCRMHSELMLALRAHRASQAVYQQIGIQPNATRSNTLDVAANVASLDANAPIFPSSALNNTFRYLSAGWPMAYLVATVVVSVGIAIAAMTHISKPSQITGPSTSLPCRLSHSSSVVGRITGMVDCVWGNRNSEIRNLTSLVSMGDRFVIRSGLFEISYNTGAKVILQGPVTYQVESAASGYLTVGKLTANLGERVEGGAESVKQVAANHKSHHSTPHSPLFTITTPTAVVTDLGTEFGVEVSKTGETTSHVFRGTIEVRTIAGEKNTNTDARVLHANESVRVEVVRQERRIVVLQACTPTAFVRKLSTQTNKIFDLVDVIAGGDGFSAKRGRGIDPTTGQIKLMQPDKADLRGNYQYHRVENVPFVDGVFIPDARKGPVTIDSAGHIFQDCPQTDNCSWAYLWAGGRLPESLASMSSVLGGVTYSSPKHAVLVMHANKGITFDLDAVRRANPGYQISKFVAVAGNTEPQTEKGDAVSADIWVLVDGKTRFKRREFNRYSGAASVNIPIDTKDRFLTLAATDAGDTYRCDHIIFGDPRLELSEQSHPRCNEK